MHGDFSEFNLLFDPEDQELFVIDVSQCVRTSHPKSFEFLKRDIHNINFYFNRLGLAVFKLRSIFEFVIDRNLTPEMRGERIEEMIEHSIEDMEMDPSKKEFEVFLGVNIPTNLFDIDLDTMERDIKNANFKDYIYSTLLGLNSAPREEDSENDEDMEEIDTGNETGEKGQSRDEGGQDKGHSLAPLKQTVAPGSKEIAGSEMLGDLENELREEKGDLAQTGVEHCPESDTGRRGGGCREHVEEKLQDLMVMDETDKFGQVQLRPKPKEKKAFGDVKYGHLTKKERKKLVKLENRERRKTKMPKKLKKKLISQKTKRGK